MAWTMACSGSDRVGLGLRVGVDEADTGKWKSRTEC